MNKNYIIFGFYFLLFQFANAQVILNLKDGSNLSSTECIGKVFDTGGEFTDYFNNVDAEITISPTNASNVTLTFPFFDVQLTGGAGSMCSLDQLTIYDGPNNNSPVIGVYCNNSRPPSSVTSTGGSITIQFESDHNSSSNAGFEINWQCGSGTSIPVVDFDFDKDETCDGLISFTNLSSLPATNWQWDFGDGTNSNLKNPSHTYVTDGLYSVKLIVSNAVGVDSVVRSNIISVGLPNTPITINDTVCIGGNAIISGSAVGGITWYDSQLGGNAISTMNNLVVPAVSVDTQIWAESNIVAPIESVGPTSRYLGPGAYFNGTGRLVFDVFEELELISVDVYGASGGNRTFELRDNNGVLLQSKTEYVFAPPSGTRADLNFIIQPGLNYQLGVSNTNPNLWRNSLGPVYPYEIANKISIKQSSLGYRYYYFFYNWKITSINCTSPRVPATIIVDTTCNVTSILKLESIENLISVFPNPATQNLFISNSSGEKVRAFKVFNNTGKEVFVEKDIMSESYTKVDLEGFIKGVYLIKIYLDFGVITKKVIVI